MATKQKTAPASSKAPAERQTTVDDGEQEQQEWRRDPAEQIVDTMSPGPRVDDEPNGVTSDQEAYRHSFRIVGATDVAPDSAVHVANAAQVVQSAQQIGFRVTGDVEMVEQRTGHHKSRPHIPVVYLVYEAPGRWAHDMTPEQQDDAITPADVVETGEATSGEVDADKAK